MARQLSGKFIKSNAIDGSKIKLLHGQSIRSTDSSGNEVELLKVDANGSAVVNGVEQASKSALDQEILDRQSGDSSTLASAQAYADQKVADLVNSSPSTLDTLNELAAALGNDASFSTTVVNQIGAVDDKVDQEILDRQSAITATQGLISAEEVRALAAEQSLSSSISNEITARENADLALSGRISPMEDILDFEKLHVYENNAQVYADGKAPEADVALRDGWYFKNTVAGQKINWYFYDGLNQPSITLGNFSAYAVMTFDTVKAPILAVYTMPTGTNDVIPGFAHSRIAYSSMSPSPVVGKKYLVYFGQNPAIHPELPRIQLAKSTSSSIGEQLPSESVLTASFGSNSADAVNTAQFMVESLGVNSPSFKFEVELRIRKASVKSLEDSISGTVQQSYVDSQDSATLASAQAYADQKVSDLINSAPAALDTLNELAAALGDDANFSATVLGQISSVDGKVDQEVLDRQAADLSTLNDSKAYTDAQIAAIPPVDLSGYYTKSEVDTSIGAVESDIADLEAVDLDLRADVDDLEAASLDLRTDVDDLDDRVIALESAPAQSINFSNYSVVVGAELAYIDLDRQVVKILSACNGRAPFHEGEDYTVSVVDGKTRLTWINSFANPDGEEKIETGDKLFFVYHY
jgi:hypothetical protein